MTTDEPKPTEPEPDPEAERRAIAFASESLAWQAAMGDDYTAFLTAQVGFLSRQYDWARERCVQLNTDVQRITEENESLSAKVAAYELSAAIEAEAAKPGDDDPTA